MAVGSKKTRKGSLTRIVLLTTLVSTITPRKLDMNLMVLAFKLVFTVWALGRADKYLGPHHNVIFPRPRAHSTSSFESDELVPAPESVLILHASETGNAQDVAERVGRELRRHGARTSVMGMEDFDIVSVPRP